MIVSILQAFKTIKIISLPSKLNPMAYIHSKLNSKLSVLERWGRPNMYLIIQYSVLLYRDISLNSYVRILRKRISCKICPLNKRGKNLTFFFFFKSIIGASSFVIIIYKILYLYTYIILLYYIVCSVAHVAASGTRLAAALPKNTICDAYTRKI